MASAGTVRFPAPAVTFQVSRSPSLALSVALLHGIAIANLLAWFFWAAGPAPVTIGFALLAWWGAALLSARACFRLPVGLLIWDTEAWSFERNAITPVTIGNRLDPEPLGVSAEVAFDLQFCMLLSFGKASRFRWVFAARRHDPLRWLALRRAVYSRATAVRRPTRANEISAFPPV